MYFGSTFPSCDSSFIGESAGPEVWSREGNPNNVSGSRWTGQCFMCHWFRCVFRHQFFYWYAFWLFVFAKPAPTRTPNTFISLIYIVHYYLMFILLFKSVLSEKKTFLLYNIDYFTCLLSYNKYLHTCNKHANEICHCGNIPVHYKID